jgi:hypothetical protein
MELLAEGQRLQNIACAATGGKKTKRKNHSQEEQIAIDLPFVWTLTDTSGKKKKAKRSYWRDPVASGVKISFTQSATTSSSDRTVQMLKQKINSTS